MYIPFVNPSWFYSLSYYLYILYSPNYSLSVVTIFPNWEWVLSISPFIVLYLFIVILDISIYNRLVVYKISQLLPSSSSPTENISIYNRGGGGTQREPLCSCFEWRKGGDEKNIPPLAFRATEGGWWQAERTDPSVFWATEGGGGRKREPTPPYFERRRGVVGGRENPSTHISSDRGGEMAGCQLP